MDIKTILIVVGLVFVLWSCAGVNAQAPTAQVAQPVIDSAQCYARIHGAVSGDWAALSPLQRALVGIKSIETCEAQP